MHRSHLLYVLLLFYDKVYRIQHSAEWYTLNYYIFYVRIHAAQILSHVTYIIRRRNGMTAFSFGSTFSTSVSILKGADKCTPPPRDVAVSSLTFGAGNGGGVPTLSVRFVRSPGKLNFRLPLDSGGEARRSCLHRNT